MATQGATIRSSASDAWQSALRLLSIRDHSREELRTKLERKRFPPGEIEAALQRAGELGYLDDLRFALARTRALVSQGKAVGPRLAQELKRHGVPRDIARRAQEEVAAEFPLEQVLRELLERRYHNFDYHQADDRERGRVVRFFQRRGFPLPLVLSILSEER